MHATLPSPIPYTPDGWGEILYRTEPRPDNEYCYGHVSMTPDGRYKFVLVDHEAEAIVQIGTAPTFDMAKQKVDNFTYGIAESIREMFEPIAVASDGTTVTDLVRRGDVVWGEDLWNPAQGSYFWANSWTRIGSAEDVIREYEATIQKSLEWNRAQTQKAIDQGAIHAKVNGDGSVTVTFPDKVETFASKQDVRSKMWAWVDHYDRDIVWESIRESTDFSWVRTGAYSYRRTSRIDSHFLYVEGHAGYGFLWALSHEEGNVKGDGLEPSAEDAMQAADEAERALLPELSPTYGIREDLQSYLAHQLRIQTPTELRDRVVDDLHSSGIHVVGSQLGSRAVHLFVDPVDGSATVNELKGLGYNVYSMEADTDLGMLTTRVTVMNEGKLHESFPNVAGVGVFGSSDNGYQATYCSWDEYNKVYQAMFDPMATLNAPKARSVAGHIAMQEADRLNVPYLGVAPEDQTYIRVNGGLQIEGFESRVSRRLRESGSVVSESRRLKEGWHGDPITVADIEQLRADAAAAGDSVQVELCNRALGEVPLGTKPSFVSQSQAWDHCVAAILDARAMGESRKLRESDGEWMLQITDTYDREDDARQALAAQATQMGFKGGRVYYADSKYDKPWVMQSFHEDHEAEWYPDGVRRVMVLANQRAAMGIPYTDWR